LRWRLLACVARNHPSETAISGYATLLRSLRSNVVSPHTHSCRLLSCFGCVLRVGSPSQPPSRGMQTSSGRCAPTSSARTPARAGFYVLWVCKLFAGKSFCNSPGCGNFPLRERSPFSQHRWWVRRPDNIGAQRLAEGGVAASGAGSAKGQGVRWGGTKSQRKKIGI
jgi:hypothetical protein